MGHRRDKDAIRHLRGYFSGRELTGIKAADVRGYVEHRRVALVCNTTINRELCVLSAAINYARREWEWEIPNPVSGRKLKEPEGRMRWITRAEAERLIHAAQLEPQAAHLPDFIRMALHTGMRKGELLWVGVAAGRPPGGASPPGAWQYQDREAPLGTAQQGGEGNDFEPHAVSCPAHPGKRLGVRSPKRTTHSGREEGHSRVRVNGLGSRTFGSTTFGTPVPRGWCQEACHWPRCSIPDAVVCFSSTAASLTSRRTSCARS